MNKELLFLKGFFEIPIETAKIWNKEYKKSKLQLSRFQYFYCKKNQLSISDANIQKINNGSVNRLELDVEKQIKDSNLTRQDYFRYLAIYQNIFDGDINSYKEYLLFDKEGLDVYNYRQYVKKYKSVTSVENYILYLKEYKDYDFNSFLGFINQQDINDINKYIDNQEAIKNKVSVNDYKIYKDIDNPYNLPATRLDDIQLINKYDLSLEDLDNYKKSKTKEDEFFVPYFCKLLKIDSKVFLDYVSRYNIRLGTAYKVFTNDLVRECKNSTLQNILFEAELKKWNVYSSISRIISKQYEFDCSPDERTMRLQAFASSTNELVIDYFPSFYELLLLDYLGIKSIALKGKSNPTTIVRNTYNKRLQISFSSSLTIKDESFVKEVELLRYFKSIEIDCDIPSEYLNSFKDYKHLNKAIFNGKINGDLNYEKVKFPSSLQEIKLPLGFRIIYQTLFESTNNLTHISIPPTIEYVDPQFKIKKEAVIEYDKISEVILSRFKHPNKVVTNLVKPKSLIVNKTNYDKLPEIEDKYIYGDVIFKEAPSILPTDFLRGFINIQSISLPSGIKKISSNAFRLCRSLKEIEIPNTVFEIGQYAFKNSGVEEVTLSTSLSALSKGLFENCFYLKNVYRYDNVIEFNDNCFRNCQKLKTLVFPIHTKIIKECTEGCTSLENFIVTNDLEKLEIKRSYGQTLPSNIVLPGRIDDFKAELNYIATPVVTTVRGTNWKKSLRYNQQYKYLSNDEFIELVNGYLYEKGFTLLVESTKRSAKNKSIVFDTGNNYFEQRKGPNVTHTSAVFVVSETKTEEKVESHKYIISNSDDTSTEEFEIIDTEVNYDSFELIDSKCNYFDVKDKNITSFIVSINVDIKNDIKEKEICFALANENGVASDIKRVKGNFKKGKSFALLFEIYKEVENGELKLCSIKNNQFIVEVRDINLDITFRLADELDLF